jgi:hypothetical protein
VQKLAPRPVAELTSPPLVTKRKLNVIAGICQAATVVAATGAEPEN